LIDQSPLCRLVGAVTRNQERRETLVRDWPSARAYDTLADLADDVDVIVVTTPADTHEAYLQEAIALKVAVVSDKPLTLDPASAQRIVQIAEAASVPMSVYQNRRWDADFLTARKVAESGVLGSVIAFESRMEQHPPGRGYGLTGGGVLYDFGAHMVDQSLQILGPAESVTANRHWVPEVAGFDKRAQLTIHHTGGTTSHLVANWDHHGDPSARYRVTGTEGTFVIAPDDGQEHALLDNPSTATRTDTFGNVTQNRWGHVYYADGRIDEVPSERGRWSDYYTQLAVALQEGTPLPVDPWDAVAALRVLDAARVSDREGRLVSVAVPARSAAPDSAATR
jgi:predicted dehydrogenase